MFSSSTGRFKRRASHAWCWEGPHNPHLNITSHNFTAVWSLERLKIVYLNILECLFSEDWGCYHRLLTTKAKQIWLAFLAAPKANFAWLAMDFRYKLKVNTICCRNRFYLPKCRRNTQGIFLKTQNVALRTIFSPGKWSDFLLLWSLWRHINLASKRQSIPICFMWLDDSTKSPL